MFSVYITENGRIGEIKNEQPGCWIKLTNPTEYECEKVSEEYNIELADVRAALDEDESSRVITEENYTLILIDIPTQEMVNVDISYTTIPLGIIIANGAVITVCSKETNVVKDFVDQRIRNFSTKKPKRFATQVIYNCCLVYQNLLRKIDRSRTEIENKVNEGLEDRDLMRLHYLESNLVYFATSLRANSSVLDRIKRYRILREHEEDEELLDDTIIENMQAIETTKIYQDIIKATSELFSTVINNRMNDTMKFLTSMTIVMAIPTIITGVWGMNVKLPFGNLSAGFLIVMIINIIACLVMVLILKIKKMM